MIATPRSPPATLAKRDHFSCATRRICSNLSPQKCVSGHTQGLRSWQVFDFHFETHFFVKQAWRWPGYWIKKLDHVSPLRHCIVHTIFFPRKSSDPDLSIHFRDREHCFCFCNLAAYSAWFLPLKWAEPRNGRSRNGRSSLQVNVYPIIEYKYHSVGLAIWKWCFYLSLHLAWQGKGGKLRKNAQRS